ncbi:MAG: hypothetical protein Aureis2KO_04920 [Aureisphaera sp.]
MERITRDTVALFNELKKELTGLDVAENETIAFTYCQISQLWHHAFSVSLTIGNQNVWRIKNWNTNFYRKGFENGWFNLDRIAINEKKIEISDPEFSKIQALLDKDLSKNKVSGFILDGLFCQLKIGNKILEWNIDREMNENLTNLTSLLRDKASGQLKNE